MSSPLEETPSPGPIDEQAQLMNSGTERPSLDTNRTDITVDDLNTPTSDNGNNNVDQKHDLNKPLTVEPYNVPQSLTSNQQNLHKNFNQILYIPNIPSNYDFQAILMLFSNKKSIESIKMNWKNTENCWETWVMFSSPCEAVIAHNEINSNEMTCYLKNKSPSNLEAYVPSEWDTRSLNEEIRQPKPAKWIIATTTSDRCNFIKTSRYLQSKAGNINRTEIKRFSKNSVLIHAKSDNQSHMLCKMTLEPGSIIKSIKPHYAFSYAKGIIFDSDLHDFEDEEILEMCPTNVCKAYKAKGTKAMVVIHFNDSILPPHIYIEGQSIPVHPYKQRPFQCYKCLEYGHITKYCPYSSEKCKNCSGTEHGECTLTPKCKHCKGDHKPFSKECREFKLQDEIVNKAYSEKISVGRAKFLLKKTKSYAEITSSQLSPTVNNPPKELEITTNDTNSSIGNPDIVSSVANLETTTILPSPTQVTTQSKVTSEEVTTPVTTSEVATPPVTTLDVVTSPATATVVAVPSVVVTDGAPPSAPAIVTATPSAAVFGGNIPPNTATTEVIADHATTPKPPLPSTSLEVAIPTSVLDVSSATISHPKNNKRGKSCNNSNKSSPPPKRISTDKRKEQKPPKPSLLRPPSNSGLESNQNKNNQNNPSNQ